MRRRVALWALAFSAVAIGAEIALQLLALGGQWILSPEDGQARNGQITLLCVGDSHTYGTPLPRKDAYPSQLEVLLESRFPGRDFRVLNRGVPGVNSAYVANRLEQMILRHRPALVLVWVGANNRWNALETESWSEGGVAARAHRLLLHVKLYRLARVAWVSMASPPDGEAVPNQFVGYRVGGEVVRRERRQRRLRHREIVAGLAFDIERMAATARALSTPILFTTYPKETQRGATRTIVETAERLGLRVVDSRESLERALAEGHAMGNLIAMASGPHPTGVLYGYVVHAMVPHVVAALEKSHGITLRELESSPR